MCLADSEPCFPVGDESVKAYTAWGLAQEPPRKYDSCAEKCTDEGLRVCLFHVVGTLAKKIHLCNGSKVNGEPCRLAR